MLRRSARRRSGRRCGSFRERARRAQPPQWCSVRATCSCVSGPNDQCTARAPHGVRVRRSPRCRARRPARGDRPRPTSDVPAEARPALAIIAGSLEALQAQIALLDREIARAKGRCRGQAADDDTGCRPGDRDRTRGSGNRPPVPSAAGATLRLGSVSSRGNTPAAARSGWGERPRWASAACDGC